MIQMSSRIVFSRGNADIRDKDDWEKMQAFLCKYMPPFETALKTAVNKAAKTSV